MLSLFDDYVLVLVDGKVIDYEELSIEKRKEESSIQNVGDVTKNGFTNYRINIWEDGSFSLHDNPSPTLIIYTRNERCRFENCQLDSQEIRFSPDGKKRLTSFWAPGPSELVEGWNG